jgi:hypothetical protein
MGREDLGVSWEKTDMVDKLKKAIENWFINRQNYCLFIFLVDYSIIMW